jgi:hypothetical protein
LRGFGIKGQSFIHHCASGCDRGSKSGPLPVFGAQDIASLTTELAKERTGHDATRSELVAARASLSARSPAAPTPPAVAAAAAAAGVAGNGDAADGLRSSPSAHTRAGRQPARKRQRGAQADDGVEDQEVEDMTGVWGALTAP